MSKSKLIYKNNEYFFLLFVLTLFLQFLAFHFLAFHSMPITMLVHSPLRFASFYVVKTASALLFGSLLFLFKDRIWPFVFFILLGLWSWAELIYQRMNSIFMDSYALTMVDNMHGFWGSIVAFMHIGDCLLFLPIVCLIIAYCRFRDKETSVHSFAFWFLSGILLHSLGCIFLVENQNRDRSQDVIARKAEYTINPFSNEMTSCLAMTFAQRTYMYSFTPIHHLILNISDYVASKTTHFEISKEQEENIKTLLKPVGTRVIPQTKLIICLVESLESWAITEDVTPNLYHELITNPNVFYAPNIKSERRAGNSADGQMIVNTGLLPIQEGAACFRFPYNTYPSLSELFTTSVGLFPHDLKVWNQHYMCKSYSIDTAFVAEEDDMPLFSEAVALGKQYEYTLFLTMSTHSPFTAFSDQSSLVLPDNMPTTMANYLKSVNYMDMGLKQLLDELHKDFEEYTVVITADHNIFKEADYDRFKSYDVNGLYELKESCPLIIFSPQIKESTVYMDECYQMDIYPTILHLIGCQEYYWQGLGINLLDSIERNNRRITEEEAFVLSDILIQSDCFRGYLQK